MKIENLRKEPQGSSARVVATLIWENRERPSQDIYFETTAEFASDLTCDPHAFLVAAVIPAMSYGEERIAIDAEICPQLREGLITNMNWLSHWYGGDRKPIAIEAKIQSNTQKNNTHHRSAFFFSGGVDALATLRTNRLNFPREHPLSVKDGIIIHGLLGHEGDKPQPNFKHVMNSLSKVAHDAEITLLPIYTNIYTHLQDLDRNYHFWEHEFEGSALSAVAHVLSSRLTKVNIASTFDIPSMQALGSHPVIDHNYSSCNLQIEHDGITLSRLAKTKLLTEWDTALNNLRVCNRQQPESSVHLNCSKCEKCIRTMLALVALNAQEQCNSFEFTNLTEALQVSKVRAIKTSICFYEELLVALKQQGRHDLARGVEKVINRYQEKDIKGIVRQIDRKLLRGLIKKQITAS